MSKAPIRRSLGQKRFLLNAAILFGLCVLLIFRIPVWGAAQIIVTALVAVLGIFQLVLYIKLR